MNRRDFSKICASAAMTGFIIDGHAKASIIQLKAQVDDREASDAYVRREGTTWIIGTSKVESEDKPAKWPPFTKVVHKQSVRSRI